MAEKSLGVVGTIVATVVGGLVLAGVLALVAYIWPNASAAIVSGCKAAWALVASAGAAVGRFFALPVPLWAFLLLGALCAWLWSRRTRPPAGPPQLNEQHHALLELVAMADGRMIGRRTASEVLSLRRLEIDVLAEHLQAVGFFAHIGHGGDGLKLTVSGRNYALTHQLTGNEAMAQRLNASDQAHRHDWMNARIN